MILGFFFLFHFLEALEGREGFFAKKGGVSLVRNRDLRPAAKANPTIQQAFERFQKYNPAQEPLPRLTRLLRRKGQKLLSVFGEYRAAHHYHHRGNGGGLYFLYEGPAAP